MRHTIAVFDYHDHDLRLYQAILGKYNFDVLFLQLTDTLQQLQVAAPHILIDGTMTGMYPNEWAMIEALRECTTTRQLPIIIATTNADEVRSTCEFERYQPLQILPKPFSLSQLVSAVQSALDASCQQRPMLN